MGRSKGKGVDVEGLDKLVDRLVNIYKEKVGDEDDEEEDDDLEEANLKVEGEEEDDDEIDDDDEEEGADGEDDEDVEINPEEVFNELSKGKSTVSFTAIKKWDLMQELLKSDTLSETELNEVLKSTATKTKNQFTLVEFQDFLDVLFGEGEDGYDDDDEDDEDDEDEE